MGNIAGIAELGSLGLDAEVANCIAFSLAANTIAADAISGHKYGTGVIAAAAGTRALTKGAMKFCSEAFPMSWLQVSGIILLFIFGIGGKSALIVSFVSVATSLATTCSTMHSVLKECLWPSWYATHMTSRFRSIICSAIIIVVGAFSVLSTIC